MIFGIGIDLVDVDRIDKMICRWGVKFTSRIFSDAEAEYCRQKSRPAMHYAARFAAKEAFLKALGIGMGMGVAFNDIEVINDGRGRPMLNLYRGAKEAQDGYGIKLIHLTLTHTATQAAAVVALET